MPAKLIRSLVLAYLYPLGINSFYFLASFLPLSSKYRKWAITRGLRICSNDKAIGKFYIFIYCDSLGEWESIKGISALIRKDYPESFIELCFFSASGFEKVLPATILHDCISYAPLDNKREVAFFFKKAEPDLVIISHHTIWPKFLDFVIQKKIPYCFVSARFQQQSITKKIYHSLLKKYILNASEIFSTLPSDLFENNQISWRKFKYYGDPRISSILDRIQKKPANDINSKPLLIFGSIHAQDLHLIESLVTTRDSAIKWIVPHEPESQIVGDIRKSVPHIIDWNSEACSGKDQWYLVHEFGILKDLYSHASAVYIGGGFGSGIHNIFEALVYEIPVIIGPRYGRFTETEYLIRIGAVHCVNHAKEFNRLVQTILKNGLSDQIKADLRDYFEMNRSAEFRIYTELKSRFLP